MCTAVSCRTNTHYFGRNLDLERGYNEKIVITPRHVSLPFRFLQTLSQHYAMIGMAAVINDYPLYFEATNEKGLSMAGLNFPQNAAYAAYEDAKLNLTPFELIPYLLGCFATVAEVKESLNSINVVDEPFSEALPVTPLHWLISDKDESITLECTKNGMAVYDNPFGVLTNNPPFPFHANNLEQYMGLHEGAAVNTLSSAPLQNHSLGMGALGLPGDFSSASRFVRAVFVKEKTVCDGSEQDSVNRFFHILRSVAMPKGCVLAANGEYEYTRYSCCCNTETQVYYYTTYHNSAVRFVDMHSANLNGSTLHVTPLQD